MHRVPAERCWTRCWFCVAGSRSGTPWGMSSGGWSGNRWRISGGSPPSPRPCPEAEGSPVGRVWTAGALQCCCSDRRLGPRRADRARCIYTGILKTNTIDRHFRLIQLKSDSMWFSVEATDLYLDLQCSDKFPAELAWDLSRPPESESEFNFTVLSGPFIF